MTKHMAMEKRPVGSQGLSASSLGLGCMGMSEFYGIADEQESIAIIHRAPELGVDFLDTADVYGPHLNEELVGRAVRGRRHQYVIATKFGIVRDSSRPNDRGVNGRPEYVRSSCEGSLRRLQTDHIDLYYIHRIDPGVPIEDTVGTLGDLVREGKIRYVGLSEAAPDTIRRAHATFPVTALQTEYSLWTRDPEQEHIPVCRELGIGVVPYSPLGRGFLSGKIGSVDDLASDDWRRSNPRFLQENMERNRKLVMGLEVVAGSLGCTVAQLALAWVMAQGTDMFPIPGTKRMRYFLENVDAARLVLDASVLAELDRLAPQGVAVGDRYTEAGMKSVNR